MQQRAIPRSYGQFALLAPGRAGLKAHPCFYSGRLFRRRRRRNAESAAAAAAAALAMQQRMDSHAQQHLARSDAVAGVAGGVPPSSKLVAAPTKRWGQRRIRQGEESTATVASRAGNASPGPQTQVLTTPSASQHHHDEAEVHAESHGDARDTAADTWNRRRDKDLVEAELGLAEGGDALLELFDVGRPQTLIARGYTRVVYGDHGAYIECDPAQVVWKSFPVEVIKPPHAYYDEYYSEGSSVKLLHQKRSVEHKPNPPGGRVRHHREGGYADYKVGMCYIPHSNVTVARPALAETLPLLAGASRRRWRA